MTGIQARRPETCDLVVHNACLLTVDRDSTILDNGAIAVRDGRILAVGRDSDVLDTYAPRQRIDTRGGIVHPGFIDAHIHVSQYTARSVRAALAATALSQGHWKAQIHPEDEHSSATLAAIDFLKCGFTGFVDPGTIFEPDAVAPVADEVGIRMWLTDPYVADRRQHLADTLGHLASENFLDRWPGNTEEALARVGKQLFRNREPDSLVRAFVGIYGEGTESLELHKTALNVAKENGAHFQMHLCYLPRAFHSRERELGEPLYRYYAEQGLLGEHVTFIHMNVVRPDDIELLARQRVSVVWCPFGQMHMVGEGGAEPRMAALQRAGVPVGLATDIPWVINFDQLAGLAIAASSIAGDTMTADSVLRALTIGAAATVGSSDSVGSLEPGKYADFVIRRPDVGADFGFDIPLEAVIHGGRETVDSVYVAGDLVFRAGEAVRLDLREAVETARQSARGLASRIGL